MSQIKQQIAVIGAGRLGLCLAVNFERSGYQVHAVDTSSQRVQEIKDKQINTVEPLLKEYLKNTKSLTASISILDVLDDNYEVLFVCLPTPSNSDGSFSTHYINDICDDLVKFGAREKVIELVINSTVMPGDSAKIEQRLHAYNYKLSYNPEFIAQGSIIEDQLNPDQVLIGSQHEKSIEKLKEIYTTMCLNKPRYSAMSLVDAEVTKLAVNCFLTTKIAFANAVGDLVKSLSGNQNNVLEAIGSDSRIGDKFLKYGYGYGGPCLPRDNRALIASAKNNNLTLHISEATDLANYTHLQFQKNEALGLYTNNDIITFNDVTYKSNSNIIEESQKLELAVLLAKEGKKVLIKDNKDVLEQIKKVHGNLFYYETL